MKLVKLICFAMGFSTGIGLIFNLNLIQIIGVYSAIGCALGFISILFEKTK